MSYPDALHNEVVPQPPTDPKDKWSHTRKIEGITNYEHYLLGERKLVYPQFVHTYDGTNAVDKEVGKKYHGSDVAWDELNKMFRPTTDGEWSEGIDGKQWSGWFVGTIEEASKLQNRGHVTIVDFVQEYKKEQKEPHYNGIDEGCLEGLIARLGYYKNSLTALRAHITLSNSKLVTTIIPEYMRGRTPEAIKKMTKEMQMRGLKQGTSLAKKAKPQLNKVGDVGQLFLGTEFYKG